MEQRLNCVFAPSTPRFALQTQFNDFMGLLPPITYDASEDLKVQKAKEDRAAKLQTLSTIRYEELVALEAEAEDFALHEYTGAHEMYVRGGDVGGGSALLQAPVQDRRAALESPSLTQVFAGAATRLRHRFLRHPGLHEQISQEILDRQFYRDLDPPEKPVELTEEQSARVEHDLLTKAGLNKADFTSK